MVSKPLLLSFLVLGLALICSAKVGSVCNETYEKVGCIKRGNYLLTLLINDRDKSSIKYQGHLFDWKHIAASVRSLVCRCTAMAKKLKYKYFGIRFYGECWAGNVIPTSANMKDKDCFQGEKMTPCIDSNKLECAGKNHENYIYKPIHKVDGGFSNWSAWNDCSVKCGGGTQSRTRKCDSPKPQGGGLPCSGAKNDTRTCNTQKCKVNGGFSGWSAWSKCSKKCGGGTQSRTRKCDSPKPQNGGLPCSGAKSNTRACNTKSCQANHMTRVCEDKNFRIKCPSGKRIHIYSAMYGRKSKLYCRNPSCPDHDTRCSSRHALSRVRSHCNRKQACSARVDNWTFGEPCPETSKYLEVRYSCVAHNSYPRYAM